MWTVIPIFGGYSIRQRFPGVPFQRFRSGRPPLTLYKITEPNMNTIEKLEGAQALFYLENPQWGPTPHFRLDPITFFVRLDSETGETFGNIERYAEKENLGSRELPLITFSIYDRLKTKPGIGNRLDYTIEKIRIISLTETAQVPPDVREDALKESWLKEVNDTSFYSYWPPDYRGSDKPILEPGADYFFRAEPLLHPREN